MYLVSSFDSDSDHFSPEEADWGADEVDFIVLISLSFVNSWSFENSCRPCLTNLWTSILRSWCLSQRRTFLVNLKNWRKKLKKNEKFEEKNVSLAAVARCGESQNSWCEGLDTDSGYQASGINTEEIFSGTRMIFDMNSEHTMQEEFNLFL